MKKIVFLITAMAMVSLMLAAPIMAAEKKAENMPIVGIVLGVLEIPVSTIKNAVNCRSVIDCINIPKHLGEGIINGGERILGTTFMPGSYERDFGENSKAASNAIASNLIGWAGTGWCAASLGMASNGIFSINQSHNALMVTGVIAGAGAAAAESIVK